MKPWLLTSLLGLAACGGADGADDGDTSDETGTETGGDTGGEEPEVYGFAGGCYKVRSDDRYVTASADGTSFAFGDAGGDGTAFFLKPSDLGTYLLYDAEGGYLVSEDGSLARQTSLQSDVLLVDDSHKNDSE